MMTMTDIARLVMPDNSPAPELSPNLEVRAKGKVYWLIDWQEKTVTTPYKSFAHDSLSSFLKHVELVQNDSKVVALC